MALPACAEFDYATFVDREPEIARLKQIVSFSLDQKEEEKPRDYQRVLHLVGKSNVGKACLLRNYDNYLDKQKVISISLSFENFNHLSDERFIIDVLNFLNEKIAPFLGYQPGNKPEMNASGLSNILTKELIHLQKKSVVAFLLDEVSMLSEGKVEMLEDSFLSNILPLSNVVVVLAGRHVVTKWKEIALRPTKGKNIVELLGFGFEYTQEQILAMDSRVIDLNVAIHEISGGSPGNHRKIVAQLNGDPSRFSPSDAIHVCNQEMHDALVDASRELPENSARELLPALEALCVLKDFILEDEMPVMLAAYPALVGSWTVQRCADLLRTLSKIKIGPGRLVDWDMEKNAQAMEEQTRFNLEKELKIRDIDLWKVMHCTAMNIYDGWAKEYGTDTIFADKFNYHKSQLEYAGFNPSDCNII